MICWRHVLTEMDCLLCPVSLISPWIVHETGCCIHVKKMLVAPTCAEKHMGGLQKFLKMELAASWATTAFPKCHRPNRIAIIGLGKKKEKCPIHGDFASFR